MKEILENYESQIKMKMVNIDTAVSKKHRIIVPGRNSSIWFQLPISYFYAYLCPYIRIIRFKVSDDPSEQWNTLRNIYVYLQPFLSVIDDSKRKNLENGNLKCKSLIKFFDNFTSYYFSLSCNNVDITFTSLVSKNLRFFWLCCRVTLS